MPFIVIKGRFMPNLINTHPDGDSVRFEAKNNAHWKKLEGRPVKIQSQNTVQLRFEGIDAIEKGAIQPLSREATANMRRSIGETTRNRKATSWRA